LEPPPDLWLNADERDLQLEGGRGIRLGGVVPYGYRKQGERNASRLVLSVEPIPGFPVSEVDVIGSIYRLCAVERKSFCRLRSAVFKVVISTPTPWMNQGRPLACLTIRASHWNH
jgi:hypothetical protein